VAELNQGNGNIRFSAADIHIELRRLKEQLTPRGIEPEEELSEANDG
jgi:hypothetical protein